MKCREADFYGQVPGKKRQPSYLGPLIISKVLWRNSELIFVAACICVYLALSPSVCSHLSHQHPHSFFMVGQPLRYPFQWAYCRGWTSLWQEFITVEESIYTEPAHLATKNSSWKNQLQHVEREFYIMHPCHMC
jgi:hypothetical protein